MSKISVLVVDDASFIRDLVKKCLRNYFPGIRTEDAINGKKAQAMLAKEAFDLVLCDWEMPEMSGLELLTWCREQDNLKTMPFIMVTSRGDKENVVQAIQAGVSGYVSKPFTNEQLLTKVKQALNKVGKLDTLPLFMSRCLLRPHPVLQCGQLLGVFVASLVVVCNRSGNGRERNSSGGRIRESRSRKSGQIGKC